MQFKNLKSAFTLLEILLVVGIISFLAGIVIIAINPSKQLAATRNTERKSDIKQLNSAITQYYIDQGRYPSTVLGTLTEICDTGAENTGHGINCTDLADLSVLVPTYITAIPTDPIASTTNGVGYYVMKDTNNKILLASERAELDSVIAIGTSTNLFSRTIPPPPPTDPCLLSPVAGTVCIDGTVYVSATLRTTPTDAGSYKWSTEQIVTNATSSSNGALNTATLANLEGVYPAADYCAGLSFGGHDDWYLPSRDELLVVYNNRFEIGGFNLTTVYLTSTEHSDIYCWLRNFSPGNQSNSASKTSARLVRCVRTP